MEFVWCSLHPIRNHSTTALLNKWVPVQCVCVFFFKLAHTWFFFNSGYTWIVQLLKMTIGNIFYRNKMKKQWFCWKNDLHNATNIQSNENAHEQREDSKKNEQLHSFAKILLATRHFVLWPIFFSLLFRIVMHFWVTKFIIWTHCRIFVYEKKLRSNLNTRGKKWRVLSSDWNVSCFYRYIKNNIFLLLQTWYLIHLVFVYLVAFYRSHFWPDVFSSKNSPTKII